jgi:transcriptional regulator with XRE-family HTH domain
MRSSPVAANVRAECARRRKTQSDLGDLLEMTHQAISRRMRRDVPFSPHELVRIARYLGVPVASLLRPSPTSRPVRTRQAQAGSAASPMRGDAAARRAARRAANYRARAAVASRLRGRLRELKISQTRLGELCGWNRGYVHRRVWGEIPLRLNELKTIEAATGIRRARCTDPARVPLQHQPVTVPPGRRQHRRRGTPASR